MINKIFNLFIDAQGGKWPYAEVAGAIEKLGCKHVEKTVSETCIDEENKIVTSPAFMYEGNKLVFL